MAAPQRQVEEEVVVLRPLGEVAGAALRRQEAEAEAEELLRQAGVAEAEAELQLLGQEVQEEAEEGALQLEEEGVLRRPEVAVGEEVLPRQEAAEAAGS